MYYPIINPSNPTTVLPAISTPVTVSSTPASQVESGYQLFNDLTTLTEQNLKRTPTNKPPGEDEYGNISFYNQNSIQLPAVGNGYVPVVQFTVPDGYNGVIKKIENNLTGGGFVDGSGDIIWQILLDDIPAKNYDTILTERGDPNAPVGISPIFIFSGQTISYVVNHLNNATLTGYTIAGLVGYFFPIQAGS